jgi:hypothetical protein
MNLKYISWEGAVPPFPEKHSVLCPFQEYTAVNLAC